MPLTRREVLQAGVLGALGVWVVGACGSSSPETAASTGSWRMPAEEEPHECTWMCFPGRTDVWGSALGEVQQTIADIALAVAAFESVRLLVRPRDIALAGDLVGRDVELIEAPVDDLWARDTLPLFLVSEDRELAAGRVRFNGWGDKQVHAGDTTLAGLVADHLGVPLVDSGIVGEGGGIETDGDGTLLAARSSWVNPNRNPGLDENVIADELVALLGAERLLWVDGLAGHDITDGHIDTLARFTDPATIIHEVPAYVEPGEVWYDLAIETATDLAGFRTLSGGPYELTRLQQPETTGRNDAEFLASYVNYYVCNDAVIVPQFGDGRADGRAAELIAGAYPGRAIVALTIDPVAAGGGGIHCATQQQPTV